MIQTYLTVRYQKVFIGTINAYDNVSSGYKNYKLGSSGFDLWFIISTYLF